MQTQIIRAALAFVGAVVIAAAAAAGSRIEIADYGVYDHIVTKTIPAPKEIAGERSIVDNVRVREQTTVIDAQRSRMFGFRFKVTDPDLVGKTLIVRTIVPRLTNPKTGQSATVIESEITAEAGTLQLHAYGFDYDWERAEGDWTFQVIYDNQVLAEKTFKVILPMN